MKLVRCKDQAHASLEEFYGATEAGGQAMLRLILRLRAIPDQRCVWGLTSIGRLCLLAADTYESPWFVVIGALDERNYFIEYLLPEVEAP